MIGSQVNGGFLFEPLDGQSGVTRDFSSRWAQAHRQTQLLPIWKLQMAVRVLRNLFECLIIWDESDAETVALAWPRE